MRLVAKSEPRETREETAEPNKPSDSESEQPEVSGVESLGVVERFESLRSKLIFFFAARDCVDPEELADATLARVFQKLCDGEKIDDLTRYSFGFAKNILNEYRRKKKKMLTYIDQYKYHSEPTAENDSMLREQQLACLEECLDHLKPEDRTMLLEYYQCEGRPKEHRLKMAERLNITREALSLRIFHLKEKLKKRAKARLENI